MIKLLPKTLTRYRHNRGFGVHSPLGYRLITGVIHERAQYYCYGEINEMFGYRDSVLAKRVFRLLVDRQSRRVAIIDDDPERAARWVRIVQLAVGEGVVPDVLSMPPMSVFDTAGYGFVICNSRVVLNVAIGTMAVQTVKAKKAWRATMAMLRDGLVINARAHGLVVRRDNLPLQVILV